MTKIDKIVKIDNSNNTEPVSFVPKGQNFTYTIGAGDTLEFKTNDSSAQFYYAVQDIPGAVVGTQDHFDDGPIPPTPGELTPFPQKVSYYIDSITINPNAVSDEDMLIVVSQDSEIIVKTDVSYRFIRVIHDYQVLQIDLSNNRSIFYAAEDVTIDEYGIDLRKGWSYVDMSGEVIIQPITNTTTYELDEPEVVYYTNSELWEYFEIVNGEAIGTNIYSDYTIEPLRETETYNLLMLDPNALTVEQFSTILEEHGKDIECSGTSSTVGLEIKDRDAFLITGLFDDRQVVFITQDDIDEQFTSAGWWFSDGEKITEKVTLCINNSYIDSLTSKFDTYVNNSVITGGVSLHPISRYSIIDNVTNGTLSDQYAYSFQTEVGVTVIPDSGYEVPSSSSEITVTNADMQSYDEGNGYIVLSNITGNVTISCTCPEQSGTTLVPAQNGQSIVGLAFGDNGVEIPIEQGTILSAFNEQMLQCISEYYTKTGMYPENYSILTDKGGNALELEVTSFNGGNSFELCNKYTKGSIYNSELGVNDSDGGTGSPSNGYWDLGAPIDFLVVTDDEEVFMPAINGIFIGVVLSE